MKKLIYIIFAVSIFQTAHGQTNSLLGQYFQNLPAYNPGHAGMNDYLDITAGYRQQWAGFKGAPKTMYISAYGVLNSGSKEKTTPTIKHGVGGFILVDKKGFFKQTEGALVYAVHIPLFGKTYMSAGMSASIYNGKIDLSGVWVKDQAIDDTYQSLVVDGASSTFIHLNTGVTMYSDKYYISYAIMEAADLLISGNDEVNYDKSPFRQHIMAGYRFQVREDIELIPNTFVRIDQNKPTLYELGLRARYNQNTWVGASYRNDKTIVGMFGFSINNKYNFSYAYEHKFADISNYSSGSHELVLGVRLFNKSGAPPMW